MLLITNFCALVKTGETQCNARTWPQQSWKSCANGSNIVALSFGDHGTEKKCEECWLKSLTGFKPKFQEFFKNSRLFTNPGVIRLRSMHSIHSSWTSNVSNRMLATYVPSMCKSNLKIRIAAVLIARNNH